MLNTVKTFLLLAALTALLLVVGYTYLGTVGFVFALVLSLIMNITTYWYSDTIILSTSNAVEYSLPQYAMLNAYVISYCEKLGIPVPKFYLIEDAQPNAFATGRDPEHGIICITSGLLKLLTIEELVAVITHELGHIKNNDVLIASIGAVMAGALSSIANIAYWGSFSSDSRENGSPFGFIVMIFLAPFTAMLLQYAISRSREFSADEISARTLGTAQPLISALTKIHDAHSNTHNVLNKGVAALCIVNPFSSKEVLELFSTHPALEKRIERLLQIGV
jgi:heat shock protein HtpX